MRGEYDFSSSGPNPYAEKRHSWVTVDLDCDAVDYFKAGAERTGVPYQSLISLYLSHCATEGKALPFGKTPPFA